MVQPALRLRPRPQKTPREARATACLNKLAQASLPGVQGLQVSAAASRRAARGARCSFYCSCHPDEVQSQGRANVKYASAHVTSVLSSFSKCEKLPGFFYMQAFCKVTAPGLLCLYKNFYPFLPEIRKNLLKEKREEIFLISFAVRLALWLFKVMYSIDFH